MLLVVNDYDHYLFFIRLIRIIKFTCDLSSMFQFDQYPMSLSYGQDQLWVGDKAGKLHLLDATDGDFLSVAVSIFELFVRALSLFYSGVFCIYCLSL